MEHLINLIFLFQTLIVTYRDLKRRI